MKIIAMHLPAPVRNPATGREMQQFRIEDGLKMEFAIVRGNRGVVVWEDDASPRRLFIATSETKGIELQLEPGDEDGFEDEEEDDDERPDRLPSPPPEPDPRTTRGGAKSASK